jgi:hypothetical protein
MLSLFLFFFTHICFLCRRTYHLVNRWGKMTAVHTEMTKIFSCKSINLEQNFSSLENLLEAKPFYSIVSLEVGKVSQLENLGHSILFQRLFQQAKLHFKKKNNPQHLPPTQGNCGETIATQISRSPFAESGSSNTLPFAQTHSKAWFTNDAKDGMQGSTTRRK